MNLYGRKAVKIPTPHFIIFYNGTEEQPDQRELCLSDTFQVKEEEPQLELRAIMLNINKGHNKKLLDACKTLRDYAEYTALVREYAQIMPVSEAVERVSRRLYQPRRAGGVSEEEPSGGDHK